jgi:alpha-L-rhamnosidase
MVNDRMAAAQPDHLLCEFAPDPLGLDELHPRFSWRVDTTTGGAQAAYQVLVASSADQLARDRGDVWDSGRVASARSTGVVYAGRPLTSRERCHWKVRLWDSRDARSAYSAAASFEMGLLQPGDWSAQWIGSLGGSTDRARYFRTAFPLTSPATCARLYVSGLGYHEIFLNGRKLGDAVLEPAYTDVTKRILYTVHDATEVLQLGENVLAAVVGTGWHGTPVLVAQLEIDCADGSRVLVASGRRADLPQWYTATGPIVANSIFDGESYDARLEQPGWNAPGFDPNAVPGRTAQWTQVFAVRAPGGRLQAQPLEPIRVMRELPVQRLTEPKPGIFFCDFGQNRAGWCGLRVAGARGTTLTLRYGELLSAGGTVNQENLRTALATDTYILRGGGEETWSPAFTYHGYRYVQVEGWPGTLSEDALVACVVRSAVANRGEFTCSHPLLNRIHALVRWTEESNLHGLPTDCPQRNERMGWLNDLAARAEELVHNFDVTRLLEKFVTDIADAQDPASGSVSDTVPFHWGRQPADPVSVAWLLMPWLLYQHHGDTRVLERHYEGFRGWVDHLTARASDGIVRSSRYGDWAPPAGEAVAGSIGSGAISARTPGELISTAYYFYAARLFARIAAALGRMADHDRYVALSEDIRAAFHRTFWNEATEGYGSGNQACNSIALYLDLVPAALRPRVVAALVREVARHDYQLTTGNLCTKYLLEVLSAEGHAEAAVAIATQTTYPGWGWMLQNGATTLWERWEHLTGGGMNSHNHPMMGSIGAWLYRWVAGLALAEPRGAGPAHFLLRPPFVGSLTSARAALQTSWGRAAIAWERTGSTLRVEVDVPWNCTATVSLPCGAVHEIASGRHDYISEPTSELKVSS